jgi:hypothetical protein
MGFVRMGPPEDLLLLLRDRFNVKTFVEGGTFYGSTALWAAAHFPTAYTIEKSETYYHLAKDRFGSVPNLHFMLGDTRSLIPSVLNKLEEPAVFWLDSHWCGGESYGADDECPLIDEIAAINRSEMEHFMLIDDARLFLAPPPRPHLITQWPTIDQVVKALRPDGMERYIAVFDDVVIATPPHARDLVAEWCQDATTRIWEETSKAKPLEINACRSPFARLGAALQRVMAKLT